MRTLTSTKILLDAAKNELARFLFREFTEDTNGNILSETEYDQRGKVVVKKTYRYFENGELKESVEYDPKNHLIERQLFFQNDDEVVDCVHIEYGFGTKIIEEYSFTELGNAEKVVSKDEDGNLIETTFYVFNDDGFVVNEIYLDDENQETKRTEYIYDEHNLLISERKIIEGDLTETKEYQYDTFGRVTRIDFIHPNDSHKSYETYAYDEHGNLIHLQGFTNGTLTFNNYCKRDELGHLLEEEFFELNYWEKRIMTHERIIHER